MKKRSEKKKSEHIYFIMRNSYHLKNIKKFGNLIFIIKKIDIKKFKIFSIRDFLKLDLILFVKYEFFKIGW